jgi:hypothetical protein
VSQEEGWKPEDRNGIRHRIPCEQGREQGISKDPPIRANFEPRRRVIDQQFETLAAISLPGAEQRFSFARTAN